MAETLFLQVHLDLLARVEGTSHVHVSHIGHLEVPGFKTGDIEVTVEGEVLDRQIAAAMREAADDLEAHYNEEVESDG